MDFAILANNWLKTADASPPITQWFQGDIHYHINTSPDDGNADLPTMTLYLRDTGGHDFTCVAGHDYIFDANAYTTSTFLGVNGVEASNNGPHVVGFGMNSLGSFNPGSGLQGHIDSIIAGGGLPMVAHPHWSQDYQEYDMPTLMSNMTNCNLISVFNYYCEITGSWKMGNSESYWDELLTNGKVIYGYAESDSHGTGKIGYTFNMTGASELTLDAFKTALQNGNSYFCYTKVKWASGITITCYRIGGTEAGDTINITTNGGETIQFIGANGSVLQTTSDNEARYTITGTEQYVRTKITNAAGDITWTQPVFVTSN